MFDPTIHPSTLARHLKAKDFAADPQLFQPPYKAATLDRAALYGRVGFPAASLRRNALRGKAIYSFTDVAEALVIRQITSNIRRITSVKQDDRSAIVSCLRALMSQGVPFRVHKFDIANFYESVDVHGILSKLASDVAFSGQSVRALASFFDSLAVAGIHGLPRGLSLSATLAEYLMRSFDQSISNMSGVWYYARFVDDIVLVTSGRQDASLLIKAARAKLPAGLNFNQKSRYFDYAAFVKGQAPVSEPSFNFLGYRFEISTPWRSDRKIVRTVNLDIAETKVRKLKTRVSKSLERFGNDGNFDNLRDRLRMLTANVVYVDAETKTRRPSGIRFNYPLVRSEDSNSLISLDRFLRMALTAPHPKNRLYPALTSARRRELAGLTFSAGFADRRFFSIPTPRLMMLSTAWSHV